MNELINREEYLDWLFNWKEKQIIKVVSGVRRCGKSTLFELYRNELIKSGTNPAQIISINLESLEYEALTDYHELYKYITDRLQPDKMNYIFIDEIQHTADFEKAVDSLFLKENCDVYITGSNAYFMSGELATVLSGRYIELKMLPLSFKEFCSGISGNISITEKFNLYIEQGAFPYLLKYERNKNEVRDYLKDIYNSVLLKDIVQRLGISDVTALENTTRFLFHNIGNIVSSGKIANTLKSAGGKTDQKTVDKYIRGLCDSLMFYEAKRYNLKGKQLLKTNSKYYTVDIGLRNISVRTQSSDIGHILENIVYLELLRRGYEVYVGQGEDCEIDFIAVNGGKVAYYQVAATALDENVLQRELAPLKKQADNYPKYLLTLDELFKNADYDGIVKLNVLEWLMN